jgi:hypothetical protein
LKGITLKVQQAKQCELSLFFLNIKKYSILLTSLG